MPPKNASLLRGLTRPFGVSRATGARWIKKKERNFLPYGHHCWLRIPKSPLPRRWNWTNCAHWCSRKPTTPGCGSPCAERAVKSWRLPLGIAAGKTCPRIAQRVAKKERASVKMCLLTKGRKPSFWKSRRTNDQYRAFLSQDPGFSSIGALASLLVRGSDADSSPPPTRGGAGCHRRAGAFCPSPFRTV